MWWWIIYGPRRRTAAARAGETQSGNAPVRYVQVGSLSGAEIALNGAVLRAAPLQLMGSGIGSLSMPQLLAATGEMLQAAVAGGFTIATTRLRSAKWRTHGRATTARNAPFFVIN